MKNLTILSIIILLISCSKNNDTTNPNDPNNVNNQNRLKRDTIFVRDSLNGSWLGGPYNEFNFRTPGDTFGIIKDVNIHITKWYPYRDDFYYEGEGSYQFIGDSILYTITTTEKNRTNPIFFGTMNGTIKSSRTSPTQIGRYDFLEKRHIQYTTNGFDSLYWKGNSILQKQ
jgi:hypothetical protein